MSIAAKQWRWHIFPFFSLVSSILLLTPCAAFFFFIFPTVIFLFLLPLISTVHCLFIRYKYVYMVRCRGLNVLCAVGVHCAPVDYVDSSREYELEKYIFFLLFLHIFLWHSSDANTSSEMGDSRADHAHHVICDLTGLQTVFEYEDQNWCCVITAFFILLQLFTSHLFPHGSFVLFMVCIQRALIRRQCKVIRETGNKPETSRINQCAELQQRFETLSFGNRFLG